MQMMVPHHAQALEMSELAQSRARDGQVVAISRRIKGAQGPEIVSMSSWLQSRDLEVPESVEDAASMDMSRGDHSGHEGGDDSGGAAMAMHGMLSEQEMTDLARARGREFDRLFIAGMIQSPRGCGRHGTRRDGGGLRPARARAGGGRRRRSAGRDPPAGRHPSTSSERQARRLSSSRRPPASRCRSGRRATPCRRSRAR